jgi:hypothetical protein
VHEYTYDISYIIIDFIPFVNSFFVEFDNAVFVRNDGNTGCLTEFFHKFLLLWQFCNGIEIRFENRKMEKYV